VFSLCDERDIRNVVRASDAAPLGSYPRLMSRTGREHTMKRTVVILGAAAAMVAAPAVASAGTSPQLVKPAPAKPAIVKSAVVKSAKLNRQRAARLPAREVSFQSSYDSRSGQTMYRLGNSGLWMQ
jgi:hypothetical protein